MNSRQWIMLVTGLALMGTAAAVLARLQNNRALGPAGLRLTAAEVRDDTGRLVGTNTVALPVAVLDFESTVLPITEGEFNMLPKDTTYARRVYQTPDRFEILTSIVLMGTDRTSIHRPEICLPSQGWTVEGQEIVRVPMTQPQQYDLPLMKMVGRKSFNDPAGRPTEVKAIYAYWFVADGRLTASHSERQWWSMVETARTGTLQRWAYVSLFALARPGMEDRTFTRMTQFIQEAVPKFQIAPATAAAQ